MAGEVTRDDFDRLNAEVRALADKMSKMQNEQSQELEKYRRFWEVKWPRTLAILTVGAGCLGTATAFAIALGVKATRRLRETKELSAFRGMIDELYDPDHSKQREFIYSKLPQNPRKASPADWEMVHQVVNTFEKIGGLLRQSQAVDMCHMAAAKVWYKLLPYIKHERIECGERTDSDGYGKYFQAFAKICVDHCVPLARRDNLVRACLASPAIFRFNAQPKWR